jgi:hypothetical protein
LAYQVKNWFQAIAFKFNLYNYIKEPAAIVQERHRIASPLVLGPNGFVRTAAVVAVDKVQRLAEKNMLMLALAAAAAAADGAAAGTADASVALPRLALPVAPSTGAAAGAAGFAVADWVAPDFEHGDMMDWAHCVVAGDDGAAAAGLRLPRGASSPAAPPAAPLTINVFTPSFYTLWLGYDAA